MKKRRFFSLVRSPLGIVGLFVFMVLVFLVPAAHLVGHRNDHVHGPFGVVATHHHDADGNDVPNAPDPEHGKGSVEHFKAAFSSAPPVVVPPCVSIALVDAPRALESVRVSRTFTLAQPRAPPFSA